MKPLVNVCLAALLLLTGSTGVFAEDDALRLLGRSQVTGYQLDLTQDDAHWLRARGTLRLGISAPDYPPFDLTSDHQYEGLSADYAALVAQLLHVQLSIHRYDSRTALIDALKRGEIDLLSTANGFEDDDPGITLSKPYSDDQPILVTRTDDNTPQVAEMSGKTIAMLNHYLPADQVREAYPTPPCSSTPRPSRPSMRWRSARPTCTWAMPSAPTT
ncbi:transporter substrate-binding domain-containing protein [Pseudomonas sp. NPDC089554]|uniref:transporter substrate-binding domain-containing protein n=1 Tax=Pseudomonas sp. NPDC089554 TaxID=3390653 RepID=UPI003CFD6CE1